MRLWKKKRVVMLLVRAVSVVFEYTIMQVILAAEILIATDGVIDKRNKN